MMPDFSLCSSADNCRAAVHCKRNPDNLMPEQISNNQSYAGFHPDAGYSCPRMIDVRKDWREG